MAKKIKVVPVNEVVLHDDDPRKWCHCGILRRPVSECLDCRDRRIAEPKRPWRTPDVLLPHGHVGIGDGNSRSGGYGGQL